MEKIVAKKSAISVGLNLHLISWKQKTNKILTIVLFSIFAFNISYSQTQFELKNSTVIEQKIEFIGSCLKNKKSYKLDSVFTKKHENKAIQKCIQLTNALPKGVLSLEKVIRNSENNSVAIAQIKPFGIAVSFYFNNKNELKDVAIANEFNIEFSNDFVLESTVQKFPFHIINGYILIEGEVNNIKGKFMFDTGTPFGFMLNKNFLKLKTQEIVHSGRAGSGQVFDLYLNTIDKIAIANQAFYHSIPNITVADFGFIEKGITADFLGFIGYEFIKNYEVVIDYDHQLITLYKIDLKGNPIIPYTLTNNFLTTIKTKKEKHLPTAQIAFGKTEISVHFDTGNLGTIALNEITKNKFLQEGILQQCKDNFRLGSIIENSDYSYDIKNANYQGVALKFNNNFTFENKDKNRFGFGYQFLKNYVTVWNFNKQEIILFDR